MTQFIPSPEQTNIDHAVFNTALNIAISALAGCGKTSTLVWIAKRLPATDSKIFCAFNADIVKELQAKLEGTGVNARTFHSLGLGALKKYLGVKEMPEADKNKYWKLVNKWAETDSVFALSLSEALQDYDPEERGEKAQSLRKDTIALFVNLLDLIRVKLVDWDDVAGMASHIAMNRLAVDVPHEALVELVIRNVEHLMKQAEAETRKLVIDFTDMIYWAVKWKLRIYPYKWVLVDEAQDFNPLQREMIAKIIDPKGGRIILVGDPNQAIYAFAGADSDSFDLSVKRWNCKVLPLNTTRRCSSIITHHASRLVPDFNCPPDKPRGKLVWIDEKEFASHVAVGDLVVSRVTAPLVKEFLGLIAKGIPSVILGKDMAEQFIALIDKLSARNDYSFPNLSAVLNTYEAEQVSIAVEKDEPASVIESIRDRCGGLRAFIDAYPNMPTLSALTAKIKSLLDTAKPKADAVVFCTVHKSKGLEADRVFILAPDKLPLIMKDMSLEQLQQENNLLYVAETRAKNTLVIVTNEKYRDANTMPSYAQEDFEDKVWDAPVLPATIAPVADETTVESAETYPSFHTVVGDVLSVIGTFNVLYAQKDDIKMCVSYSTKWHSYSVKTINPDGKESEEIVTASNDTLHVMKQFQPNPISWQFLSLTEWEAMHPVTPVGDVPKPVVDAVFKTDGLFVEAFTSEPTEPMPKITLVGFAENTSPNFAINVTALLALLPKSSGLFAVDGDTKMYVTPHITEKTMFFVETANGEYTQETLSLKDALAKMEAFSSIVSTWNTITSDDWMFATAHHQTIKAQQAEAQPTPLIETSAPLPFASILKPRLTALIDAYDPDKGLSANGKKSSLYITTNWDGDFVVYERDHDIDDDILAWSRDITIANTEEMLAKMQAHNPDPASWDMAVWGEWIKLDFSAPPTDEQESTPVEAEAPAIVVDEPTTPSADANVEMIVKLLRIPESPDMLELAHAIHTAALEHLPNINRETLAGISKLQVSLTKVMFKHNYPPAPSGIYRDNVIDDIALFLVNGTLPDAQDPLTEMVAEISGVIVADEPPADVPVTPSADALLIEMIATCLDHPTTEAGVTLARAIHTAVSPILIRLDWKSRHDVANMRIAIKRVMREHHYPPSDSQLNMNDVVDALAHLFEHGSLPDAPAPDTRTPFAIAMTPRMRLLVTGSKEGLFCNGDSKTLFIEIAPDESIVINEFVYATGRNPVAVVNIEPALASMESHNPNPDAWQVGEWDTWYKDARKREDAIQQEPADNGGQDVTLQEVLVAVVSAQAGFPTVTLGGQVYDLGKSTDKLPNDSTPESTDTTIEAPQPIVSAPPVVAPIPEDTPANNTVAPDTFSNGENSTTPEPLPSTAPEMLKALIDQFRVFELNELALVQQAIDYIKREKEGVNA